MPFHFAVDIKNETLPQRVVTFRLDDDLAARVPSL